MNPTTFSTLCATLRAYAAHAHAETGVPGIAIAIVARDGDNWLQDTICGGERRVNQGEPVTPDTVFQLASLSKPLSTTVLAAALPDPSAWFPTIGRIASAPTATELLAHRSGLPGHAGDLLEDLGRIGTYVFGQLDRLPCATRPTPFQYTNFGFSIGALAIAGTTLEGWDPLAQAKLFGPLGMRHTSYRHAFLADSSEPAWLHRRGPDGSWTLNEQGRNADAQAPAGGACASANDMLAWLGLLLGKPGPLGEQAARMQKLNFTPVYPTPAHGSSYGRGWNLQFNQDATPDNGVLASLASHSGAFGMGAATNVLVVPGVGGIVVLTNGEPIGVAEAVGRAGAILLGAPGTTLDALTGARADMPYPFTGQTLLQACSAIMHAEVHPPVVHEAPFTPGATGCALPPQYIGRYDNAYYGELLIQLAAPHSLSMWVGRTGPFLLQPDANNPLVYRYDSVGENGSDGNLVVFATEPGKAPTVIVENLYETHALGNPAHPAPPHDAAAEAAVESIGAPIGVPGRLRAWRLYAVQAGPVQLVISRPGHGALASQVEQARPGVNLFLVPDGMLEVQPGDLIGFAQPAHGVVGYTLEDDGARSYAFGVDVVHFGKFVKA